jgi:hypothetical protein
MLPPSGNSISRLMDRCTSRKEQRNKPVKDMVILRPMLLEKVLTNQFMRSREMAEAAGTGRSYPG